MASLGPRNYGVVVLHVGGSKASNIKLVLPREPRTGTTWFLDGSILPNEAPVDAAVRELFEKTGLTVTIDDLTLLSGNLVRVPLPAGRHQLVHIFSASVRVPYVTVSLRTPTKVEHVVNPHSTIHPDGSYVVPTTVDIDELSLTPSQIWLVRETQRNYELLHFDTWLNVHLFEAK
jgi:8-oxo-dGTP pyrophosphatase MutT (NUDIX family)